MITVISEGNARSDGGRWYQVKIGDQVLNLLSKTRLKPGSRLVLEKQTDLNLKVVKDFSNEKSVARATVDRVAEPVRASDQVPLNVEHLFSCGEWLNLLSVNLFEQGGGRVNLQQTGRKVQFSMPLLGASDKIEKTDGVFILHGDDDWQLFLTLPESLKNHDIAGLEQELVEFFAGLPVKQVKIVNADQVKALGGGLDLSG